MSEFMKRFKQIRTAQGITQAQLAKKLNVTQTAITYWENGKREPSIDMISQIANALNISEQELLGYDNKAYALHKAHREHDALSNVQMECSESVVTSNGILISDQKLLNEFHALNIRGKREAIIRVSELKHIPGYTSDTPDLSSDIDIPFK